jgi:hypothetical protein
MNQEEYDKTNKNFRELDGQVAQLWAELNKLNARALELEREIIYDKEKQK